MSAARLIKYLHLAYLAKPVADRIVYRTIQKTRAGHLLGIGLADVRLASNMIQLAAHCTPSSPVRFVGIDLFEMRPSSASGLPLKQVHCRLSPLPARVRLIPGDPFSALARTANTLSGVDLVVIRADQDPASLARAWFYVPRVLHTGSLVLLEQPGRDGQEGTYRVLDLAAVQRLAASHGTHRRAA